MLLLSVPSLSAGTYPAGRHYFFFLFPPSVPIGTSMLCLFLLPYSFERLVGPPPLGRSRTIISPFSMYLPILPPSHTLVFDPIRETFICSVLLSSSSSRAPRSVTLRACFARTGFHHPGLLSASPQTPSCVQTRLQAYFVPFPAFFKNFFSIYLAACFHRVTCLALRLALVPLSKSISPLVLQSCYRLSAVDWIFLSQLIFVNCPITCHLSSLGASFRFI